ncbi:hypothetical protein [Albibacillus kandeliae]|uniref:hypothetical protein n=1 Tax=Albibacillus kandeliae TaxID=2174228 RepID=UPI000D6962A3|nr:hypothetical protein [Albibacillus kandeliae]
MSYHDPKGFREARERARAQAAAEAARIGAVKARGAVPDDCGPEIPEAPARGAYQVVRPQKLYPDGRDGYVAKDAGYLGRAALRHADAFDVMRVAAAKRKKPAPFTETQVAMGRHYRDLVERHASAGIRGSSFTRTRTGGTGQSGAFIDALMQDRQEIDRLLKKIGPGIALEVRRVRPSDRGTRSAIPDRALVDMVCIGDKTISDVLRAHGWSVNGRTVGAASTALGHALDRMVGPTHKPKTAAVHYGDTPVGWQAEE